MTDALYTTTDPRYSGIAGRGVAGYGTWGTLFVTPGEQPTTPELIVFDTSFVRVATVNQYTSLTWTQNQYIADTFEIIINRYTSGADQFVEEGFVAYQIEGVWQIGIVKTVTKPLRETGQVSEMFIITGKGYESVFESVEMDYPWATDDGYDSQAGAAETNVREYVDHACISCAITGKNIPGLSLETVDGERGDPYEYKARSPLTLAQVIEDHARFSALAFKPVWVGYADGETDREQFVLTCFEGTDRHATVKISVEFGNMRTYNYRKSTDEQRTVAVVMGPGTGTTRLIERVWVGTEPTGRARKEIAVDANDCTTSQELIDRGMQTLVEKGPDVRLEFDYNHLAQSYVIGVDFDLGDLVSVEAAGVVQTLQVTSVTDQYSGSGKTQKVGVGKEFASMKAVFKDLKAAIATGARK